MKTAIKVQLYSDQSLIGSRVINFDTVVKKSDDIELDPSGTAFTSLKTQPLLFGVSIGVASGEPVDVALMKNDAPFKQIAKGAVSVITTVIDPTASKGDKYGIQVGNSGGESILSSSPLETAIEIVG